MLSLPNSLTVVVASAGMPFPTDTVTFCPFFPARSVKSVLITGFFGLTLMVTSVVLTDLSEYVPLILRVNTPTVSVLGAGELPFHVKVGCFSSFLPFLPVTNLSISVNFGNGSPTVISMVLPLRGFSSASVVTLTVTLRLVTLPEPSSEVIITFLFFIF